MKKEEEFPELRPVAGVSSASQSSNGTNNAGLSIADKLKLRQLYLTYPSSSRETIRQLYLSNDRSAHNVMAILGFSQSDLSARVTSRLSPPPPLAPVTSPGSSTSSSSATASTRTGTTDLRPDEEAAESKRNGRKGGYVPWTVVDSARKQKKQQPQRYIPGLNQPDVTHSPEINTEAHWREQAAFAKQRMRESFLQAAQLRRYAHHGCLLLVACCVSIHDVHWIIGVHAQRTWRRRSARSGGSRSRIQGAHASVQQPRGSLHNS